jgi:hypothetical protein
MERLASGKSNKAACLRGPHPANPVANREWTPGWAGLQNPGSHGRDNGQGRRCREDPGHAYFGTTCQLPRNRFADPAVESVINPGLRTHCSGESMCTSLHGGCGAQRAELVTSPCGGPSGYRPRPTHVPRRDTAAAAPPASKDGQAPKSRQQGSGAGPLGAEW